MRWECTTCNNNLCTSCFIKENPHNIDHRQFKRHINDQISPVLVYAWDENGLESRSKLIGIFPGAKVINSAPDCYDKKSAKEIGFVVADKEEDATDQILVEWSQSKKKMRYKRLVDGKPSLSCKELSIGGNLHLEAFPLLMIPLTTPIQVEIPAFSAGDRVRINPLLDIEEFKKKMKCCGGFKDEMAKFIGAIGTVLKMNECDITVAFKGANRVETFLWLCPSIISKLNKFSLNQVIRIRDDQETVQQIEKEFANSKTNENDTKMEGTLGRVTGVSELDPEKLFIQFDNDQINKWLYKGNPLPSKWMELFETAQPSLDKELVELAAKQAALFFKAVKRGDLRTVKILHKRHGVDVDTLDETSGYTALQLACQEGYKDLIQWLLDDAQVELEKPGFNGWRALHSAVLGSQPEIVKMLIERGAQLNSRDHFGYTALHLAVVKQFTECASVLIQLGCDVNLQDKDGNTPLHLAILIGKTPTLIQLLTSCGRIDWKLRDKNAFNVLHLAVAKGCIKAIELVLNNENKDLLLESMYVDVKTTVLHHACAMRDSQVAKLLVGHQKLRNQIKAISSGEPETPNRFERFLESKNEDDGRTALLISCYYKDYTTVDILIEAGANVAAIDSICMTALTWAALPISRESFILSCPTEKEAPSIYQFYQNLEEPHIRKMMETYPILFLILYLIEKGCRWDDSKRKVSDILLATGYNMDVVDLINKFAADKKKKTSVGVVPVCMGQQGECQQPANFKLSCPHLKSYSACTKCFLGTKEKMKCGCADETIAPITDENSSTSETEDDSDDESSDDEEGSAGNEEDENSVEEEEEEEEKDKEKEVEVEKDLSGYNFKLIMDGTVEHGYVEDQLGNKYNFVKLNREDLVKSYRCGGCPSVVQCIYNRITRQVEFRLDSAHSHPGDKRKRVSINSSTSAGGSTTEPIPKRDKRN